MRLKNYIIENSYKKKGRGKEISKNQVLKILPKFSDAIKVIKNGGIGMRRTVTGKILNYYLVNPKSSEPRVSYNTFNYYTLIIDNSKKWSKYPKRSQSIICSSFDTHKLHRGDEYIVLPKNGAKIGECPSDDFWFSFVNIGTNMRIFSIDLNNLLNYPRFTDEELQNKNWYLNNQKKYDKNYNEFKKACEKFDDWVKNTTELTIKEIKDIINVVWLDKWNGKTPILKYIDNLLDPKKHGFTLSSIENIKNENVEVWTDSESLLINTSKINEFLKIIGVLK
jgi:hypothetical protein